MSTPLPTQPPLPQDDHDIPVIGVYIPNVGIVGVKGTAVSAADNYGVVTALLAAAMQVAGADVSQSNPLATNQVVGTPITATTTSAAGASCTATLAAAVGKTTCINQVVITIAHATSGNASGTATLSLDGGSTVHQNFIVGTSTTIPALVDIGFPDPLPAKATNQTIVVTVPAITNGGIVAVSLTGYQL